MTPLGKELRKARIDLEMLVCEVAKNANITTPTVNNLETGKTEIRPNLARLVIEAHKAPPEMERHLYMSAAQTYGVLELVVPEDSQAQEAAAYVVQNFRKLTPEKYEQLKMLFQSQK